MESTRLHLGCGAHIVPGWVNIDGSWNARLAQYPRLRKIAALCRLIPPGHREGPGREGIVCHNITKRLPFSSDRVEYVYGSHVLEHLYYEDARNLLIECYRVLKVGGVIRMVVPDVHTIVLRYLELKSESRSAGASPRSADQLNHELGFRKPSKPKGGTLYRLYSTLADFHNHKWMYDAESLCGLFTDVGFNEVEEKGLFESRIQGIETLELSGRVKDGRGICVEGVKA